MATCIVAVLTVVPALVFTPQTDAQLAALNRMVTTVNEADAAGYARLYAPDAIITIYGTGELKGRAAIQAHEVELLRQFPGARLAFSNVWQDGRHVVVRYAINARTPNGLTMGHDGLLFLRFDTSGAIIEEHRYQDSLTPMAQLGALRATAFRAPPVLPARLTAHVAAGSTEEQANGSVVTAMLAAMHGGDASAARGFFAVDATIDDVFLPQPFLARDAAASWIRTWTDASPSLELNVTTLLTIGDFVLVESVTSGSLLRSLGLVPASRRAFEVRRGFIVRLGKGKITSLVAFMNGKELAESGGSWPLK
jgi:hypothetical protein